MKSNGVGAAFTPFPNLKQLGGKGYGAHGV